MKPIRVASWFSGIGGFELGLRMASPRFQVVSQSEIDPYCSRLLERRFPGVVNLGDIKKVRPEDIPDAELWAGGFPCQPFSCAGKRKATDDSRDLWPDWFRLIASRRPRWILGENVPGLLTAEGGQTWGRCIRDLASVGYVGQWRVLGARDVGAPHRRDRLWVVAYLEDTARPELRTRSMRRGVRQASKTEGLADSDGRGQQERSERDGQPQEPGQQAPQRDDACGCGEGIRPECWCGRGEPWCCDPADVPNAIVSSDKQGKSWTIQRAVSCRDGASRCRGLPQPRVGRVAARLPGRVDRVATGVRSRVDRLRGLGNAVVPQCVAAIATRLLEVIDS